MKTHAVQSALGSDHHGEKSFTWSSVVTFSDDCEADKLSVWQKKVNTNKEYLIIAYDGKPCNYHILLG